MTARRPPERSPQPDAPALSRGLSNAQAPLQTAWIKNSAGTLSKEEPVKAVVPRQRQW